MNVYRFICKNSKANLYIKYKNKNSQSSHFIKYKSIAILNI